MTTYVSTSVFQAIQKLFPNAITLPVVITDGQFETCSECSREKTYMADLPGKLLNLVASNEKIFEPFKSFDDINRKGCLRLIHIDSFPAKVASLIKKKCPPKKGKEVHLGQLLRTRLLNGFFQETIDCTSIDHTTVSNSDTNKELSWPIQSLICKHRMSLLSRSKVEDVIHQGNINDVDDGKGFILLSEELSIQLVSFIFDLQRLLNNISVKSLDRDTETSLKQMHTEFERKCPRIEWIDGRITLLPSYCHKCNGKCFQPDKETHVSKETLESESTEAIISDDISKSYTTAYNVYTFDYTYDLDSIKKVMDDHHLDHNPLKLSRRKRKILPVDLHTIRCTNTHNLAFFRLKVKEWWFDKKITDQHLYVYVSNQGDTTGEIKELSHDEDERFMHTILDKGVIDHTVEVILHSKQPRKKLKKGDLEAHDGDDEALMNTLMSISQTEDSDFQDRNPSKETEKGFNDTLLLQS